MRANPTETLQSWGLKQPESGRDWSMAMGEVFGTQALLEQVAVQSESIGREIGSVLLQSNFVADIESQMATLMGSTDEVTAIEYLRNLFGEPQAGAEGALDVYMELASDQVGWQITAKRDAQQLIDVLQQKQADMVLAVQRIVLAELARIETELADRQEIIDAAEVATQEHEAELKPLLAEKRRPLDSKQETLIREKTRLHQTLAGISGGFQQMSQQIEYQVRPVQTIVVGPTHLRPELAA